MVFGMLASGTSVKRVAMLLGCPRVIVHNPVRRYNQTEINIDLPGLGDLRQQRRDYYHAFAPAALAGNCNF